jgi:PAS domain S-box-containing protein
MADADGSVSRDSPSWSLLTGQTPAEQHGWGWLEAVDAADRSRLKASLSSAILARSAFRCEQALRRADGSSLYTRLDAVPILDSEGRVREWIGAVNDIGDRRRIESQLETQNRALEALAAGCSLEDVLACVAHGVEAQTVGARCSIMLVHERRLRTGAAPSLPREYVAAVEGLAIGPGVGSCGDAAHAGRPMVAVDIAKHPNWEGGRQLALLHGLRSCWSTPILSRIGEVLGVFAVYHDRPYEPSPEDFRIVEAATLIAGIAIEQRRSDQALRARNQELLDVDRRKDLFLAMLGHELRNPLEPLQLVHHLMDLRVDDPGAIRQLGDIIERQTRQLTRLVDDLLDVSRITRGAIELRRETVSVQSIVSRALESLRVRIAERRQRLDVGLPEQPAWLDADPIRMIQVMSNLLDNASKYTDPGGEIFVSVRVTGGEVVITVRDTGVGMQPEIVDSAFQLFTQANTSLARSQGGLGIGLTLVRNLVEMHGGRVSASSPGLGLGSEFVVRLPLAREGAPEAETHKATDLGERRASRKRVLIVEDNDDTAKTLEMALVGSGFDVNVAKDGRQALAVARAFLPDISLIDIGLPGMDGYEVARRLRAEKPTEKLHLIAITGYGQEQDRERALQAGFDRHLVKPFDLDTVLLELSPESGPQPLASVRH